MLCFDYRRFIRVREMAFGTIDNTVQRDCDVVYMHSNDTENLSKRIKNKVIFHEQFTLVNDLSIDENTIFDGFNKTYKNEIRRAIKDGTQCSIITYRDSYDDINAFESIYNNMFFSKGLSNRFNKKLVVAGLKKKQIIISKAKIDCYNCVVYHAYLSDGKSTMLMYSASTLYDSDSKEKMNLIGRINKYLHWFDMLWFKANGYLAYEWGGINNIETPNGIARFKMGFNGKPKKYMNYLVATSLFGKIYIYMVKKKGTVWK